MAIDEQEIRIKIAQDISNDKFWSLDSLTEPQKHAVLAMKFRAELIAKGESIEVNNQWQ